MQRRRVARPPPPLPEWMQFMAVVLCILQACKQANITQTQHDGAGRPTEVIGAVVSDGYGNSASPVTQTIYDAAGNVASTIRSHK